MKKLSTTNVLGYEVFSSSLKEVKLQESSCLINTFSPNSYGLALKDKEFQQALKSTDILVLDGIGIAVGSILLHGRNIKKIAGQDCFDFLMPLANAHNWKVFFLGSSRETLDKIIARAKKEFPDVNISTYSPPFSQAFSEQENQDMLCAINSFGPDILFIGMTAPKQEKWGYQNRGNTNARIICTIGNVFDWYAGNSKRPARIWINLRLEWLVRIFVRPEILQRNTKNQLLFLRDLFLHISHIKRVN